MIIWITAIIWIIENDHTGGDMVALSNHINNSDDNHWGGTLLHSCDPND